MRDDTRQPDEVQTFLARFIDLTGWWRNPIGRAGPVRREIVQYAQAGGQPPRTWKPDDPRFYRYRVEGRIIWQGSNGGYHTGYLVDTARPVVAIPPAWDETA